MQHVQTEVIAHFTALLAAGPVLSLMQLRQPLPPPASLHAPIFASQVLAFAERVLLRGKGPANTALAESLRLLQNNLLFSNRALAANLAALVQRNQRLAVFGVSETVLASLGALAPRHARVLLVESGVRETGFEAFAARLRADGRISEGTACQGSDIVLVGAEAVFRNGVLTRPGSLQLAAGCRYLGRQFLVAAETTKFSDRFFGGEAQIFAELGAANRDDFGGAAGLHYDFVGLDLVTLLVTERGNLSAEEAQGAISKLFVVQ
ncbi:Initiation factor 2 subunit family protein [Spironucleus salmonicida]|uniref:Initiation factor 2 subunit family protein n=1 Tax=Spironucleus salmonicida TaxID=348837 RepID=V6LQK7_9EUKA|nr:Initiation factor 2 subunit family protein [Spironucleus salmonicida]KAH0575325.1 Initiation factor 2 subunit family protein [Spironucleus salmonicida]|eukprot:EST46865.1 Initiation factor 2 subunit family protein [Spironucleus salmonicida]